MSKFSYEKKLDTVSIFFILNILLKAKGKF